MFLTNLHLGKTTAVRLSREVVKRSRRACQREITLSEINTLTDTRRHKNNFSRTRTIVSHTVTGTFISLASPAGRAVSNNPTCVGTWQTARKLTTTILYLLQAP